MDATGKVPDGIERWNRYEDLIAFARTKLLCDKQIDQNRASYPAAARAAVLDVRIMLALEAGRPSAHRRELELVESHMRTVYSIPRHREYIRSGYSSEPILAEAAAQQLHFWRTTGAEQTEPAALILQEDLDHDLLSRGEIGEAVGRLLLILARDHAAVATSTPDELVPFSRAVPVNTFIEELFTVEVVKQVLDSMPDNLPGGSGSPRKTFKEAFKGAVLNFTHFAEWVDDSALSEDVALGCFMREMALFCRNGATEVDVFLPVLLDEAEPLSPCRMSGILVQFKLRAPRGTRAAYVIDQEDIGLFPAGVGPRDSGKTLRPYITLIMELGVTNPPPQPAGAPANLDVNTEEEIQMNEAAPPPRPSVPQPATRRSGRVEPTHPRYSMYAYGCSHSVYRVIGEREQSVYDHIVRAGKPLAEHPRQDAQSLGLVRQLKPFFIVGDVSWHWLQDERLNMMFHGEEGPGGVFVGSLSGGLGRADDDDVDMVLGEDEQ